MPMRRLRYLSGAMVGMLWLAPLCAQQSTGTIRGRVTDATTQQLVSGVMVAVGSRAALTQADGRYLITGGPPGADSLRTGLIGDRREPRPFTVVGGEELA